MKGQAQVVEAFIPLQSLSLICTCENGHVATIVWIHSDTLTVSLEPTLLRWSVRILLGHMLKKNVGSWVCVPTSLRPKQGNWSERQTIEWISNEPNFITYSDCFWIACDNGALVAQCSDNFNAHMSDCIGCFLSKQAKMSFSHAEQHIAPQSDRTIRHSVMK